MKRILLSALISASIVGVMFCAHMMYANVASADPKDEDAFQICDILNDEPTMKGLDSVAHAMLSSGLTGEEAGETLFYAMTEVCPQFFEMAEDWAKTPTPPATEPMGPPGIWGPRLI